MAIASNTVSNTSSSTVSTETNNYRFPFALVTSLFFMFGFITCLNDILVPHFKALFTLDYTQAALVQFCFFAAFFVVSLPAGKLVAQFGYQRGAVVGLLVTALGCGIFYFAASMQSYAVFLFGLFVLATGITIIQVAVNPYISILGPKELASTRLTLAQAFNSLGTTIAPLFGSAMILAVGLKSSLERSQMDAAAEASYRTAQASAVQIPYIGFAITLCVLALIMGLAKLPQITSLAAQDGEETGEDRSSAWQYKHLVLGAIGIFCYVGAEVAIGSFLVSYLGLSAIASMPEATAGKFVAYYWGGAMIGRFIGSAILAKAKPGKVLAVNAFAAAVLVLAAMALSGHVAMIAILSVGFFNSIMFPTIFTLAITGLGKNTAQGSGILCMAIVGGAVIPLLQGFLADHMGLHHSFWLPIVCYLFIAFYGLSGYKVEKA